MVRNRKRSGAGVCDDRSNEGSRAAAAAVHGLNPPTLACKDGDTAKSMDICPGSLDRPCNKKVHNSNLALQCEHCTKWFHIQCQNVSKVKYEAIRDLGEEVT